MSSALRWIAASLGVLAACAPEPLPPRGHVLLFFDTDAPVVAAVGEASADGAPPALFDRLLVEIFEPGKVEPCLGCRREIALDRRMLSEGRASIQVPTPASVPGYRVRARLFLGAHLAGASEPPPSGTIEVVAALPASPGEGGAERTIFFATEDVGLPRGTLAAPVPPSEGRPSSSRVGTWPGAAVVPCEGTAGPGEACVPGGAFWMGRPGERTAEEATRHDRPRLVVVSPTWFDVDEASVSASRETMLEEGAVPWSGSSRGELFTDFCTFTQAPGKNERLAINCLSWPNARNHCLAKKKELPTEAELEHAAGALASRRFVWGDDPPQCEDAVFGRGGVGYLATIVSPCRSGVFAPGCVGPSCARRRDVLTLGDVAIRDLAGNVAEWTLDVFDSQDEPCWSAGGVRRDPSCNAKDTLGKARTVKGGSWISQGNALAASGRQGRPIREFDPGIGVRCVRPGVPRPCGPAKPGRYTGYTAGDERGQLLSVGVGCNGVISAFGVHNANDRENPGVYYLAGNVDADGSLRMDGRDVINPGTVQRFVGKVVGGTRMEGSWASEDGKRGTWDTVLR